MSLREYLAENIEEIAFGTSVVAACVGGLALAVVLAFWKHIESRYKEFWAKIAVAVFRLVAVVAAVASKTAPTNPTLKWYQQPWVTTVLIAGLGYLFWEISGAVGDAKYKQSKEKKAGEYQDEVDAANQDREDAEFQALRLGWLLSHLRELVSEKRQRIRGTAQSLPAARTIHHAREGLDPVAQVHVLLEWLASLFQVQAMNADPGRFNQNFRVGLYAECNGRLELVDAFDLATRRHDPFSSHDQHADRFRLDETTKPSHAVRCLLEGRTLIASDCETEPGFEFFHERQRQYLRSMVAHPMEGFSLDGVNPTRAALLIDTDVAGFFREDDREMIELLLREFVARIDLEYAISGLTGIPVNSKGGSDERSRAGAG